jgi:cytoskeletal protein CcmA (bactofilin family)
MFDKGSRSLETIIGKGSRFAGELSAEGTVRIDGIVEGNIQAHWVVVSGTGVVAGDTRAHGMIVGGKVRGSIEAAEIVELKGKAEVVGEIHAPKLTISAGALFDGQSKMRAETAEEAAPAGNVTSLLSSRSVT